MPGELIVAIAPDIFLGLGNPIVVQMQMSNCKLENRISNFSRRQRCNYDRGFSVSTSLNSNAKLELDGACSSYRGLVRALGLFVRWACSSCAGLVRRALGLFVCPTGLSDGLVLRSSGSSFFGVNSNSKSTETETETVAVSTAVASRRRQQ